jgi:peptidoglycan/xylan/chitin deacetylase (PgdA/CDA1 family)
LRTHGLCSTLYITSGRVGDAYAITAEQVGTLAGWHESVELGAHTVTYTRLDELSTLAAEREIRDSRDAVEQLVGRRVDTFAYPHGAFNHHDPRTCHRRRLHVGGGREERAAPARRSVRDRALARAPRNDSRRPHRGAQRDRSAACAARQRVRTRAFGVVRRARRRVPPDRAHARSGA